MIRRLASGASEEIEEVGGKASGLGRLLDAGATVPEAWVVPAGAAADAATRQELLDRPLADWWAQREHDRPGGRWAVRSSAIAEDSEQASFAGVYRTVLGVASLEDLRVAIVRCWDAFGDPGAARHRDIRGRDDASGDGIALVLQRMVDADVAGVMLTVNPMRPFAGQVVIDASYGLGEAVVSGRVEPDHLVLDRVSGVVEHATNGTKEVELRLGAAGAEENPVDRARRERRCLTDEQIAQLHRLALTVTAAIGPRRDLEWAFEGGRLYVLQDRPVTGLPPEDPVNVWTRRFGDEYLADYTLPLARDTLWPWITGPGLMEMIDLMGVDRAALIDPIREHDGYAYLSGEAVAAQFSVMPPRVRPETMLDWFPSRFQERLRRLPLDPRRSLLFFAAPLRDRGRGGPRVNVVALERHAAEIGRLVGPWLELDLGEAPDRELRRQWEEIDRLGTDHFRVIRWGMFYAQIGHDLLAKLLARWARDDGELYAAIAGGLPGTYTAELNGELHRLAAGVAAGALGGDIRGGSGYEALRAAHPGDPFWSEFDAFVRRHGHRGSSRDVSMPRWGEEPDVVFGLVAAQVRGAGHGASPAAIESRAVDRRRQAEREALALVARGPLGGLRRRVLGRAIGFARQYTVFRENQRYHLDYLISQSRRIFREQGRRLAASGVLEEADDVFLLRGGELAGLLEHHDRGPEAAQDLRVRIEERREHYRVHRDRLPPTYLYDGVPTEGEDEAGRQPQAGDGSSLTGLAAAPGHGRGRTRTVRSLGDLALVRSGEVLVAANIDPGWTSVFPLLAGLITETGGMLSHGAILAREYGVPTVTGVRGAVALLATGTAVEVDGRQGAVRIVPG